MRSIPWSEMRTKVTKEERTTGNHDHRSAPRAKISQPLRVRPETADYPAEMCTTLNVSRTGVYFATEAEHYFEGMKVFVTRNFRLGDPINREELGTVVRVDRLQNGKCAVAIHIV